LIVLTNSDSKPQVNSHNNSFISHNYAISKSKERVWTIDVVSIKDIFLKPVSQADSIQTSPFGIGTNNNETIPVQILKQGTRDLHCLAAVLFISY